MQSESKYKEILREAGSQDILDAKARRQSAALTTLITALLFLLMYFLFYST